VHAISDSVDSHCSGSKVNTSLPAPINTAGVLLPCITVLATPGAAAAVALSANAPLPSESPGGTLCQCAGLQEEVDSCPSPP
jgi:hypothetical protein